MHATVSSEWSKVYLAPSIGALEHKYLEGEIFVRFEVFTAVTVNNAVF
jgi:hypothetical protein